MNDDGKTSGSGHPTDPSGASESRGQHEDDGERRDDGGSSFEEEFASLLAPVPAAGAVVATAAVFGTAVPVRQGVEEPAAWAATIFAALTLAGFLARRHWGTSALRRQQLALFSGGSALAALLGAGYAIVQGVTAEIAVPLVGGAIPLMGLGGAASGIAVGLAVADYRGLDGRTVGAQAVYAVGLTILGGIGLFATEVVGEMLAFPVIAAGVVTGAEPSMVALVVVSQIAVAVTITTITVGYVRIREFEWSFIDLRRPTIWDAAWIVGGVVVLFAALIAIGALFDVLGVESSEHGTVEQAENDPRILLVLIPASILVIGPFEELLYRNVIQKTLYERFSRSGSILVASVIFAVVHAPAYAIAAESGGETIASLGVIFSLSIFLGYVYHRTENILVPALVHGLYNAIVFAQVYVYLTL